EAHHPDPLLERGGAAPAHARRPAAAGPGLRRGRVAHHRRRLHGRHRRGGARGGRGPHRPPHEQQGAGGRLPGGARRLPEARRRRHRQHGRRQPVLGAGHPPARRPHRGRVGRHGRRGPRDGQDRALLAPEEAPAEARLLGRAPGLRHGRARHHLRLSRLQPRGRDPDGRRLEVHLHPRDDHPGRQAARGHGPRPHPDERPDARVAPVPVHGLLRAPQRRGDRAHLRAVRAAEGLHDPRARALRARHDPVDAVLHRLRLGRRCRPRAVAHLRGSAVQRVRRARRAGDHRRPALRPADHVPAHLRARPADRAAARRPALALRAGCRAHGPGAHDGGQGRSRAAADRGAGGRPAM
ncbi:MAG: Glycosyltransferase, partial [uncultured Solirubrobacteraceae bacterium]